MNLRVCTACDLGTCERHLNNTATAPVSEGLQLHSARVTCASPEELPVLSNAITPDAQAQATASEEPAAQIRPNLPIASVCECVCLNCSTSFLQLSANEINSHIKCVQVDSLK